MTVDSIKPIVPETFTDDVEVSGHIIDSLILPKILDCITVAGGVFQIKQINIGQAHIITNSSY